MALCASNKTDSVPKFGIILTSFKVSFFDNNGSAVPWEKVNAKANIVLLDLKKSYRRELESDSPLV